MKASDPAQSPAIKDARAGRPAWRFVLLWMGATAAGVLLYAIPVTAVYAVLDMLGLLPGRQAAADSAGWALAPAAMLSSAAAGLTVGLAQWLVLRGSLARSGGWVAATTAGWAAGSLLPLLTGVVWPGWAAWALTLIVNGKLHWLARVEPVWAGASWPAGAATLALFGLVLGAAQWRALRGRVRQAGWWVAISGSAWALGTGFSLDPFAAILGSWLVPTAITGGGLAWLLGRPATARRA